MAIEIWPTRNNNEGTISYFPMNGKKYEIDLRQEFEDLIEGTEFAPQRGHWILLRRMARSQRCNCWKGFDTKYVEPDPTCPVCQGEGWIYAEELHKVRSRIVTPVRLDTGLEQQAEFAIMQIPSIVYYFKFYVAPTEKDRILEIDNTADGKPVIPYVRRFSYNINFSEPFRDQYGRIEYWRCACKKEELRYGGLK